MKCTLDDQAIDSLNDRSGAADLVRAVLGNHDSEYLAAWAIHEQIGHCKAAIERWQELERNAKTPSEVITAEQRLVELRQELEALSRQVSGAEVVEPASEQAPPSSPEQGQAAPADDRIDASMLAEPDELIKAFGRFTGMDKSWFNNITDKPGLAKARRVTGQKGKGGHAPLFCPLAVMEWLTASKRKVGGPISEEKAWSLLESCFPMVYAAHSSADPREG